MYKICCETWLRFDRRNYVYIVYPPTSLTIHQINIIIILSRIQFISLNEQQYLKYANVYRHIDTHFHSDICRKSVCVRVFMCVIQSNCVVLACLFLLYYEMKMGIFLLITFSVISFPFGESSLSSSGISSGSCLSIVITGTQSIAKVTQRRRK